MRTAVLPSVYVSPLRRLRQHTGFLEPRPRRPWHPRGKQGVRPKSPWPWWASPIATAAAPPKASTAAGWSTTASPRSECASRATPARCASQTVLVGLSALRPRRPRVLRPRGQEVLARRHLPRRGDLRARALLRRQGPHRQAWRRSTGAGTSSRRGGFRIEDVTIPRQSRAFCSEPLKACSSARRECGAVPINVITCSSPMALAWLHPPLRPPGRGGGPGWGQVHCGCSPHPSLPPQAGEGATHSSK